VSVDSFRNATSDFSGRATDVLSRNVADKVPGSSIGESLCRALDILSACDSEEESAYTASEVFGPIAGGAFEVDAGDSFDTDFGKGDSGKVSGTATGEVTINTTGQAFGMTLGTVNGAVTGEAYGKATGEPSSKGFGKSSGQVSTVKAEGIITKSSRASN